MPYFLSPMIRKSAPPLWMEGDPYSSQVIYDIQSTDPKTPPVHYESHTLKPHSLCHMEAPGHTMPGGKTVEAFFEGSQSQCFYGPAVVVRLGPPSWQPTNTPGNVHWEISLDSLTQAVVRVTGRLAVPERLLVTPDQVPVTSEGEHSPSHAFTLSVEAAEWLSSEPNFKTFGTSWKSTDFKPGERVRPIHERIFRRAAIFECLKLNEVPEGVYFWVGFPLPLVGATESPLAPALFTKEELKAFLS